MKEIRRIQPVPASAPKRLRVAAYARISEINERSPLSLSTQVSYYQRLITENPAWEYAGVYADAGISGTNTLRPQFQELLAQARKGDIDLILTKSISRFSRNTLDLLSIARELKDLGVEIRFEKEGISTMSGDGELMLTLLASFAQAESEQLSANVKWRVTKQFEQGLANGFRLYGYTNSPDATDVEIIEEEAEVVRRVFAMYLEEISCERMAQIFEKEGIQSRKGEPLGAEVLRSWLDNETYTGTLVLGRHYSDVLGEHSKLNKGEMPMYRVENAIPAIISPELFARVQAEKQRRRRLGAHANWSIPTSCLTSIIKCSLCGMSYSRSGQRRPSTGEVFYIWICRTKRDGVKRSGGRRCTAKNIPEVILHETLATTLGFDEFDPDVFTRRVEKIFMDETQEFTIHYRDGNKQTVEWTSDLRLRCWTPERRAQWGELHRKRWQDPQIRQAIMDERRAHPRKRSPQSIEKAKATFRANWSEERSKAVAERNRRWWAQIPAEERSHRAQRTADSLSEEAKQRRREKLRSAWTPERRARASQLMREMRSQQTREETGK